jgi:putative transcriptional regulator
MAGKKLKGGTILLAEPFMLDPNFKRTAVLLCEHSEEGSIGFVLNKRMDIGLNELIADFPEFDTKVYFGGPVQTDTIHYIHNVGDLLDESRKIADGVWWGGNFETLKVLVRTELIKPENIRFFVGYSGWSETQLEEEMETGSWVTADMHPNYVFKSRPDSLWSQIMSNKGDLFTVIASMPDSVTYN